VGEVLCEGVTRPNMGVKVYRHKHEPPMPLGPRSR
jgi:hypothetical protein